MPCGVSNAESGECLWQSFTGGAILYPPTIDDNRLFVGSGDGWIYAYEALTGTRLWRFRAAPVERKISNYGRLTSTWPVASGILVDDGVLYAAAGIASYDGTHVYALDAASGNIRWQNNSSGHFLGDDRVTGVSVQGHLLLHKDRLYMAGGNVISPAIYDKKDGRCLNTLVDEWGGQTPPEDPEWQYSPEVRSNEARQKKWGKVPRGCELFLIDGEVVAFDRLLYSPKEYWAGRYFSGQLLQAGPEDALIRVLDNRVARVIPGVGDGPPTAAWRVAGVEQPRAMAVGANAVIVAGGRTEAAGQAATPCSLPFSLADGSTMWSTELPAPPSWWGVAIDRAGRIGVTLQDGSILGLNGCHRVWHRSPSCAAGPTGSATKRRWPGRVGYSRGGATCVATNDQGMPKPEARLIRRMATRSAGEKASLDQRCVLARNRNEPSFDAVRTSSRPSPLTSAAAIWSPTPLASSIRCGWKRTPSSVRSSRNQ